MSPNYRFFNGSNDYRFDFNIIKTWLWDHKFKIVFGALVAFNLFLIYGNMASLQNQINSFRTQLEIQRNDSLRNSAELKEHILDQEKEIQAFDEFLEAKNGENSDFHQKTTLVKQSCAEWSKNGVTENGFYLIDPDGQKGVDAFEVYCEFSEIDHRYVRSIVKNLNYGKLPKYQPSLDQIETLIKYSTYCRQRVVVQGVPVPDDETYFSPTPIFWKDRLGNMHNLTSEQLQDQEIDTDPEGFITSRIGKEYLKPITEVGFHNKTYKGNITIDDISCEGREMGFNLIGDGISQMDKPIIKVLHGTYTHFDVNFRIEMKLDEYQDEECFKIFEIGIWSFNRNLLQNMHLLHQKSPTIMNLCVVNLSFCHGNQSLILTVCSEEKMLPVMLETNRNYKVIIRGRNERNYYSTIPNTKLQISIDDVLKTFDFDVSKEALKTQFTVFNQTSRNPTKISDFEFHCLV